MDSWEASWFVLGPPDGAEGIATDVPIRERMPSSGIALGLVFFENQFNDAVIVRGSETVAMRFNELGASIFGLLACRVESHHVSADLGHAQLQVAASDDCAKLVRHKLGPFWNGSGSTNPIPRSVAGNTPQRTRC